MPLCLLLLFHHSALILLHFLNLFGQGGHHFIEIGRQFIIWNLSRQGPECLFLPEEASRDEKSILERIVEHRELLLPDLVLSITHELHKIIQLASF